ncbi:tRNA 2-selenouridine(34) synthase MnmH [Reinekea sp.]|uniref:tRNA 2-selenouridine(34) synthase MnmH n=1 Tax=Reinekea sp. TaxID=1970455 RepID=UPI002A7F1554|nr:tRNA 2-selenouridine(34) synthase MnmH [Reinekea sp.]
MQPIHDFTSLFLQDRPMMDVRAPVEYAKGAFPSSHNLPLMVDSERQAVGTCYKEQGQAEAIELGHQLVQGDLKAQRIQAWVAFVGQHPEAVLYCFRGGLRSRISQQWLSEAGVDLPMVEGGYKALRAFLLERLHARLQSDPIRVLSGATGSGKTEVIRSVDQAIDLEGLANHRGSAFGYTGSTQPAQIDFENAWSVAWMKLAARSSGPVLFEDEGRLIGRVAVLPEFLTLSKESPILKLTVPLEQRIQRICRDYFQDAYHRHLCQGDDVALAYLDQFARGALTRIQKRLGGVRFGRLIQCLDAGLIDLAKGRGWTQFEDLIALLLSDYYDPMYDYQFAAKAEHTLFEGNHQEILQWLAQQPQN